MNYFAKFPIRIITRLARFLFASAMAPTVPEIRALHNLLREFTCNDTMLLKDVDDPQFERGDFETMDRKRSLRAILNKHPELKAMTVGEILTMSLPERAVVRMNTWPPPHEQPQPQQPS